MPAPHHCLHCGQALDLADTNVATDVALCRACGRSMPFSAVAAKIAERRAAAAAAAAAATASSASGGISLKHREEACAETGIVPTVACVVASPVTASAAAAAVAACLYV